MPNARALLATAVAAAVLAPPAQAAVDIGPEQVTVSTEGAAATATRAPFRLTFSDGGGKPVLAQVENSRPAPFPIPPAPEPQPAGSDSVDGPSLYTPFTFTVGQKLNAQFPATQYVGNQLVGAETGVQFSARDVTEVARVGGGVKLTVATSDPGGRVLEVTLAPAQRAIRVSARVTPDDGVAAMADSFASAEGEAFRGFGGRHNSLDQRGNDFFNWVQQQNTGPGPAEPGVTPAPGTGGETYQFPNGPAAAYYVQSQFVSSRGYGFLLDRDELSGWRMASDRPDAWQVSVAAAAMDYLVAPGEGPRAIRTLTAAGGRHRLPPDWALGPQLDRAVSFGDENAETYTQRVREDLDAIERYDLPLSAYRFEGWEFLDRQFLRESIERLRSRGIRSTLYWRAFVGTDPTGTDSPRYYDEAVSKGYVAKTSDGRPYVFISNFSAPSAQIDFTNPEAVSWWEARIREGLDLGADGFMQDFGEQVQNDMHFVSGETGVTMHNRYPVLFHETTRGIVERYERDHPDREIWFFTRAGYSGTPGAAAFEDSNFPGDETTDWSRSSGLASQATNMLNRAVGGAYGYTTDIGGYFDFHTPATTKELFIRWSEWAALSPLFRLHGSLNAGTHVPWSYDDETVEIYERLSRLHMRAVPLIRALWREAAATGMPITRPMWLAYPDDPDAAKQDQQWMLGDDVLVAPVVEEGATGRTVQFPRGCWEQQESGARFEGPRSAQVEAPLGRLPWFVRCGTSPLDDAQAAACGDRLAPRSIVSRRSLRASRRAVSVRGRSRDLGCAGLRHVYVSIARVDGAGRAGGRTARCRFVSRRGRVDRRARSCRRPVLLGARGSSRWRFVKRLRLSPGSYRLQVRAVDTAGNKERPAKTASISFRIG